MDSILETPRLILRRFVDADSVFLFKLNSDREVLRHTGDDPFPDVASALRFIQQYDHYQKYGYGRWTVVQKDTRLPIGWCGLKYNEDIKETDLGFRLLGNEWRKGYATEAARACIDYGFRHVGLSKIIGRALKENRASIRVLEKIGMTFQHEFDAHGARAFLYSIQNPSH